MNASRAYESDASIFDVGKTACREDDRLGAAMRVETIVPDAPAARDESASGARLRAGPRRSRRIAGRRERSRRAVCVRPRIAAGRGLRARAGRRGARDCDLHGAAGGAVGSVRTKHASLGTRDERRPAAAGAMECTAQGDAARRERRARGCVCRRDRARPSRAIRRASRSLHRRSSRAASGGRRIARRVGRSVRTDRRQRHGRRAAPRRPLAAPIARRHSSRAPVEHRRGVGEHRRADSAGRHRRADARRSRRRHRGRIARHRRHRRRASHRRAGEARGVCRRVEPRRERIGTASPACRPLGSPGRRSRASDRSSRRAFPNSSRRA